MVASISVSCALEFSAATVTSVTGASGNDVLQRRLSGWVAEMFQRSNAGQPPAAGKVTSAR